MVNGCTTAVMNNAFRFVVIASAALLVACDSGPTELRLVAPSSSLDLEIAQNLAALLDKGSEFRLDVTTEQHAGEVALDMLLSGEADIALVSNYLPYREGVSTVMPLYASVLHIAYLEGRDPSNGYTLLNNASIFAGAEGSASRLMFERITARIGLSADAFSYTDQIETLVHSEGSIGQRRLESLDQ